MILRRSALSERARVVCFGPRYSMSSIGSKREGAILSPTSTGSHDVARRRAADARSRPPLADITNSGTPSQAVSSGISEEGPDGSSSSFDHDPMGMDEPAPYRPPIDLFDMQTKMPAGAQTKEQLDAMLDGFEQQAEEMRNCHGVHLVRCCWLQLHLVEFVLKLFVCSVAGGLQLGPHGIRVLFSGIRVPPRLPVTLSDRAHGPLRHAARDGNFQLCSGQACLHPGASLRQWHEPLHGHLLPGAPADRGASEHSLRRASPCHLQRGADVRREVRLLAARCSLSSSALR